MFDSILNMSMVFNKNKAQILKKKSKIEVNLCTALFANLPIIGVL